MFIVADLVFLKAIQVTAFAKRHMLGNFLSLLPSADFFRDKLF